MQVRLFKGRLNRARYFGYTVGLYVGLGLAIYPIQYIELLGYQGLTDLLACLSIIIFFLLSINLVVLRFHDLGKDWENLFLLLIPVYNIIIAFELLGKRGETGPNRFGDDPLAFEIRRINS